MGQDGIAASRAAALRVVHDEFAQAIAATECDRCGCLRHTIEALEKAAPVVVELVPVLDSARRVLVPQKYKCLGCEINSERLARELAQSAPDGLDVVGTMRTESLGIERVIRNVQANSNMRFLVLCGDD